VEAEPGDYISIARKAKGTNNWFIGTITDESRRNSLVPLLFLDKGKKYLATIYRDAVDADWKTNPERYTIEQFIVESSSVLKIPLASGGGAAVSLEPATAAEQMSIKKYK
jgi:hypothetical protein